MQTPWFTAPSLLHLIHFYPIEAYHDARFEKDTRYYVIRLSKDLLEDWVITLINGRIKSKLGQSRTLAFAHFNEAFEHFCLLGLLLRNLRPDAKIALKRFILRSCTIIKNER